MKPIAQLNDAAHLADLSQCECRVAERIVLGSATLLVEVGCESPVRDAAPAVIVESAAALLRRDDPIRLFWAP